MDVINKINSLKSEQVKFEKHYFEDIAKYNSTGIHKFKEAAEVALEIVNEIKSEIKSLEQVA